MPTDSLYYEAARITSLVAESKGTIRNLCYNSKYNNKKALFALVSETCKSKAISRHLPLLTVLRLEVFGVCGRKVRAVEA